jgi:hypothetical protein
MGSITEAILVILMDKIGIQAIFRILCDMEQVAEGMGLRLDG